MSKITEFSINRPVTISMIFIIIAITSVIVLTQIPVSYMPDMEFPRLIVYTSWSGAAPEEVEKYVTSQIEEAGSEVKGVVNVNSSSETGLSEVTFEFNHEIDIEYARFELNEKLQLIQDQLPENIQPHIQTYIPRDVESSAFLEYGISGKYETWEMKELAEKLFVFRISSLAGIADVSVRGAREREILIELINSDINQADFLRIRKALLSYGNKSSVTNLKHHGKTMSLIVDNTFSEIHEIENLEIVRNKGDKVRLRDVAQISYTLSEAQLFRRYNGEPQIVLEISKDNKANAIKLSSQVKELIEEQKKLLPSGITMVKLDDEAETITKDLKVLYKRGIYSLLIIFAVLILFLRHLKSTFLVVSSIFLSTAMTFLLMYLLGIGLNLMSLAGLSLGFGMIVDNSIVIYENIFRNQKRGLKIREAALIGTEEVSLPIVASTLTTMIVFAPFLFIQGDFKALYLPFVNSLVLSLFSSLVISFTFIPYASTHFLKFFTDNTLTEEEFHFNPKLNFFQKFLKLLLRFRWVWISVITILFGFTMWLFITKVDKGDIWSFPKDDYLQVQIVLPKGSEIEQTDFIVRKFDEILEKEDIAFWKTYVSSYYGYIRVDFDAETKKTVYPLILREKLKAYAVNYGNSSIYIRGFGPSFGGGGATYSNFHLQLKGYNYQELKRVAENLKIFMEEYSKRVQNININSSSWWNTEKLYEYEVTFDRQKMAKYQLDMNSVVWQLYIFLNNKEGALYRNIGNEEVRISIKEKNSKFDIDDLRQFTFTNSQGQKVNLTEFTRIEKTEVMNEIERTDELYVRNINFDFRGSYKKGEEFIDELKQVFPLPMGYVIDDDDNNYDNDDEQNKQMIWMLIASALLVYMSLAALFESFRSPFVIILTLPLAFIGVAFIFYFFEETFNFYARMGLILLSGIVVNNSIILIYRIIQLQQHGVSRDNSILQATRDRARPILMTSLTTILGLIPMLIRTEVDKGDFWRMLAFSTMGGLTAATIFSIIVTPVIYRLFSKENLIVRESVK